MKLILGFLFCLMTTDAFCQTKNSLIWQISGNELTKTSYLFGTIHAIPQDKIFINQEVIAAFLKCDVIVLETSQSMTAQDSSTMDYMMPRGSTLRDLYTKKDYEFLERYLIDTLKGSVEDLITFKPIWLINVISSRWYKNYVSYESMFITKAIENNKNIIGLDEFREMIDMINQVPLKEQASILLNTIKNRKSEELNYNCLLQLYLQQDVNQIHKQLIKQLNVYPKYFDLIFNNRNDKWIYRISKIVKDKSCFIAVGAGHLGGKLGLIAQLKKNGYKVEPL
jgi:uncharacterized protein YbaP (TraB family)